MTPPPTVRDARPDDAPLLAEYNIGLAFETEALALDPATVRAGVEALLADRGKGHYYMAEVEGRPAGCLLITFEWSDWRNALLWWIQSVYVSADHRRRGVFSALLAHVEAEARRSGVKSLRLYMEEHNETARATYVAKGLGPTAYVVHEKVLST